MDGLDKTAVFRKNILCLHILPLQKYASICQNILCVYMCSVYKTLLLFVKTYCVFTCIPFIKLCYYSSKATVCLPVFRLESSAIIRQKLVCVYVYSVWKILLLFIKSYRVFTCIPFIKLCYYSSQDTLCLRVFRLENSAIIRQKLL